MRFFFDESGDFTVPSNTFEHRASVVVGVSVSELVEEGLQESYAAFVEGLADEKKHNGEPKGRLFDPKDCHRFCRMLAENADAYVTPVTLDLTCFLNNEHEALPKKMKEILQQQSLECIHETMRDETALLGRQLGNLSSEQALRIAALAYCFQETVRDAVMFLSCRGHEGAWEKLSFEIDAAQRRPGSREHAVFSIMLLSWLTAWSRSHPLPLVKEIHTSDHPFVRLYEREEGIDLGKIVRGNLHWVDSSTSWGIQIADISASIVHRAVHDLEDEEGWGSVLGHLMRSSVRGPRTCLGLFSLSGMLPSEVANKYRGLCNVIAAMQKESN